MLAKSSFFDIWAHHWRQTRATGDMIIVRFCDDFVVGFQYRQDAEQFKEMLVERFRKFNLELHVDKTRIYAAQNRRRRGLGKTDPWIYAHMRSNPEREVRCIAAHQEKGDPKEAGRTWQGVANPTPHLFRLSASGLGLYCTATIVTLVFLGIASWRALGII